MCIYRRFISACAFAQFDPNLHWRNFGSQECKVSSCRQRRLIGLCRCVGWFEASLCTRVRSFSHVVFKCSIVCFCSILMTDSICHSSLPRTVLEKVTLTTIQFRIYPRTKIDSMFQCVSISTPLKSCPYKSSASCV